ncbi:pali-domain-containing protein, partial [Sistotremastrum niveocremeum HHB9708]
MASPATPGLFFCFAAMVLLIFVSVSVPVWDKISFLDANISGRVIRFGCWGYTGSAKHLGYSFDPSVLGFNSTKLNSSIIHNLTFVLILHPIGAGLAGLAVLFGLCGEGYHRSGTILMSLTAGLATIVVLIAWVIDMVLWGIARDRIRSDGPSGSTAQFGNANWLTLGALVALMLGFCAAGVGSCGRY